MQLIIGRKPVLEAINSGVELEQVVISYGQTGNIIETIIIACKKKGIKCSQISTSKFSSLVTSQNSQGVAAIKIRQKYFTLAQLITDSKKSTYPLILILDSIQDTHNVGAILRTADCVGVDCVIITKHNSAPLNETVSKTSAGAIEHLKICPVTNLADTIRELKQNGFWIIGSALQNSKPYTNADYKIPLALIVGNEEKGIRRLTADSCDILVNIPMKGKIQSLNVSVASGVLLFEILRQRTIM